jgi:hypothetical protein
VLIKYFLKDIQELSQDKVINVRISLSEAFYKLSEKYKDLELLMGNRKITIK